MESITQNSRKWGIVVLSHFALYVAWGLIIMYADNKYYMRGDDKIIYSSLLIATAGSVFICRKYAKGKEVIAFLTFSPFALLFYFVAVMNILMLFGYGH